MGRLLGLARHSARRLSGLSVRQAGGLLLGALICLGVAAASLARQAAVATCLLALLPAGALADRFDPRRIFNRSRLVAGL